MSHAWENQFHKIMENAVCCLLFTTEYCYSINLKLVLIETRDLKTKLIISTVQTF